MTKLTSPVSRETAKLVGNRPIILTVAPLGSQNEARLGFRLKGKRTQYVMLLSDAFRFAALAHGNKERTAKRDARRNGISWRIAKKKFIAENSI